jgi:hypothetical protein
VPANRLTDSGERTRPRVLRLAPSPVAERGCNIDPGSWYALQRFAARARQTAREARAVPKGLEADLLGVLGLDPAAQVIRQRGVHPIAARA